MVAGSQKQLGQAKRSLVAMTLLGILIAGFGLSRNLMLSTALLFGAGGALMVVFALNSSLVQLNVSRFHARPRHERLQRGVSRRHAAWQRRCRAYLIKATSAPVIMTGNGLLGGRCWRSTS